MENFMGSFETVSNLVTSSKTRTVPGSDLNENEKIIEQSLVNFKTAPTDTRLLRNESFIYGPLENVEQFCNVYNFVIEKSSYQYCFLNQIILMMELQLMKLSATDTVYKPVEDNDNVTPEEWIHDILWSDVSIYIGDSLVTDNNPFRGILAAISRELSYKSDAKASYLALELGYNNKGVNPDLTTSANEAFVARKGKFVKSGTKAPVVHVMGVLTHGLSSLTDAIINGLDIRIVLTRAPTAKVLIQGPKEAGPAAKETLEAFVENVSYQLFIRSIHIKLQRPQLSERALLIDQKLLSSGHDVKYYLNRTITKWISVPTGVQSFRSNVLFPSNDNPYKVMLAFFSEKRLNGHIRESIQHYMKPATLQYCDLFIDNNPVSTIAPSHVRTYDQGLINYQYLHFWEVQQKYYTNEGPPFTLDEFSSFKFLPTWDLSAGGNVSASAMPLVRAGAVRLHLDFTTPLTSPLNVLVFGVCPALMTINNARVVKYSYA